MEFFLSVQRLSFERIWLWHFSAEINNIYIPNLHIEMFPQTHSELYFYYKRIG